MRKSALWCIPCAFFVIATVLNLLGKLIGLHELSAIVKPALLPLLSATCLAFLVGREYVDLRATALLVSAQLFGCVGDVLLIPDGFPFFASGIAAFLVGHIFYMCLFGGQSWRGLAVWQWAIAIVIMGATVFGLVKAIGINGVMFWPMLIYGFGLMMLIFSALAGVLRMPRRSRGTWWILLAGALLFTFSDALIAMETFDVLSFSARPFVIMLTYLAAQALLAVGGVRLILRK